MVMAAMTVSVIMVRLMSRLTRSTSCMEASLVTLATQKKIPLMIRYEIVDVEDSYSKATDTNELYPALIMMIRKMMSQTLLSLGKMNFISWRLIAAMTPAEFR